MSDLEKFIALYKSFGIDLDPEKSEGGTQITMYGEQRMRDDPVPKLEGYSGFHSEVNFNHSGKFVSQGFWE